MKPQGSCMRVEEVEGEEALCEYVVSFAQASSFVTLDDSAPSLPRAGSRYGVPLVPGPEP